MERLQADDFLRYTYISDLVSNPKKDKCAFVTTHCNMDENNYKSYIHTIDVKTKVINQITFLGEGKNIVWLDDENILFVSNRDAHINERIKAGEDWTCFYKLSLLGGEAEPFLQISRKVQQLFPLYDGTFALVAEHSIAEPDFSKMREEERSKYFAEKKKREESYAIADEIPYRFEGQGIINNKRWGLYIYNPQDDKYILISDKEDTIEFIKVNKERNKIIYSPKKIIKNKPKKFLSGISIYDVEDKENRTYIDDITYRMRYCDFIGEVPIFMGSDGIKYGYQQNPDFFFIDKEGKKKIFYYNDDSASNAVCTDIRTGKFYQMETDNNSIYYVGMDGGNAQIYQVDLDGAHKKISSKIGSVDSFVVLDKEIMFIGLRDNKLQEIYSLKDGNEIQLSSFNDWVVKERTLSKIEKISFVNKDGTVIEGYVLRPTNYQQGKKYPGIVYIHGGHKMNFSPVYYHELQLFANEGYYVMYCNPRGSDGFGNEFADIIGRYGYADYDDIMEFTDFCLKNYPEIDENLLGVGGGSYGGFMTNWVIGHTDRFKCAVSQRGISNFISMFGTSDTSYNFPMWQFETDIWMDIDRYWQHSPLRYAKNVKTPTLFIHAEEDYRCPISEGMQMFLALKYNGIESKLCIFKREGHELSRSGKPFNRLNRLNEILGWFNQYLQI
ncbi:alpha/beta hydrolase family protein [Paratissierella segnis]|jgi:dipeptidyl aminopeptidase/acylaminoacyl peptidase|uniref:S9 family peptidase n=1 Tax=Paratissierella segnis TaxID=2763679 RepID=A0A926EVR0_9FIRM|nr:S9 family peptidase [Paratissierella segnis]MBC8587437.1 S9 family peptidase [Paratissierella segnis]